MRKSPWGTVLLAVVVMAPPLRGQQAPAPACVFDTAAFRETFTVWLALEPPREAKREAIDELTRLGIAIAQRYRQPARLSFRTWPGTYFRESDTESDLNYGGFGMDGMLRFVVDSEGRLDDDLHVFHDSPEISRAVQEAVTEAASAGAFALVDSSRNRRKRTYTFRISGREAPKEGAVVFTRLPLPAIRLGMEPTLVRPGVQRYPEAEKREGRGGTVRMYYVINSLGRVVPGSIVALELTSLDFARAAETMLLGSTFTPAKTNGCPLPTGVNQTIRFVIR